MNVQTPYNLVSNHIFMLRHSRGTNDLITFIHTTVLPAIVRMYTYPSFLFNLILYTINLYLV